MRCRRTFGCIFEILRPALSTCSLHMFRLESRKIYGITTSTRLEYALSSPAAFVAVVA